MNTLKSVFIVPYLAGHSLAHMKVAGSVMPLIKQYKTKVENVCIQMWYFMHHCTKELAQDMYVTGSGMKEYSNLPLCIRIQMLLTL